MHRCQDCGKEYTEEELDEIDDLFQRVGPGEIMPSGQCPDPECGALCIDLNMFKILKANVLRSVATDEESIYNVGRLAVEDFLVEMRDMRVGVLGSGNGLVICEKDGTQSDIIRMTVEHAIQVALKTMADNLARDGDS